MIQHSFTTTILAILAERFGKDAKAVLEGSPLLQYLNIKTRSASRGSKSRGSFANLYAVYVLVEDYLAQGFDSRGDYGSYQGAVFSALLQRQRELPFGSKLQNHALNHRMNEEFKKYFPTTDYIPILRDPNTNRYWINENLLRVIAGRKTYNIGQAIVDVIDAYVQTKRESFESFIAMCEQLQTFGATDGTKITEFIAGLVAPNVDARIFEIVSFAILKAFYGTQFVYFGYELDSLSHEPLQLFKTGRTNANDGGIDFVMRPLGRFFQVTETLDTRKYFLDIDKLEHYPITFVIKSAEDISLLRQRIAEQAKRQYSVDAIVNRYMAAIEEIVNIPELLLRLRECLSQGTSAKVLDEVVRQSKVEFNYEDPPNDEDDEGADKDPE